MSGLRRFEDPGSARDWCADGPRPGFVPTMGALHEGHLELVRRSIADNPRTCVSVFVNPLQFDDPQDLAAYPRDFAGDAERLASVGCDMVFTGTLAQFFPDANAGDVPRADAGPAAHGLEGAHRAGHFEGVATIVRRLFELVRPARAYFGAKDFQQTLVVQHVARTFPRLEVVVCPTVREPDGLALSSRNARLDAAARERAVGLSAALFAARDAWRDGVRDAAALEALLHEALERRGIDATAIDYAAVRDPSAWTAATPSGELSRARALVAARVGGVRLIDNLALHEDDAG